MLILILSMMLFALWRLYTLYHMQKSGKTAEAIIEGFAEKENNPQSLSSDEMSYAPIFSFTTMKGKKITVTSSTYSKLKKHQIGDIVTVHYSQEKPLQAILEDNFPWKFYLSLAFLGLAGSALLIYYLVHPSD
ncbi:uncharacterized protein DUF3592 [Flavobacteriaceae bacterium MAR_2009_75]|nr:uncharacterized protein DUF3592 [Flavobacteriaceae bacterium MAR_2009_75]